MSDEKVTEEKSKAGDKKWRKRLALWVNGKFFPRTFFIRHWGVILTLFVMFLSSIAHRNMYFVQINKIKKLDTELVNRRTDRKLLKQQQDGNMQLHEMEKDVEHYDLELISSPEPKGEIVVVKQN